MEISDKFKYVWETESREVSRLCGIVDYQAAGRLCEALEGARENGNRIFFAGVGTSAAAARKAAHSFSCVEFPSSFLSPGDAVHGGLGVVQAGDVAILISKGGNTAEIVNLIDSLKGKHAWIAGVTENPSSKLGTSADLVIQIKISHEPDLFNMLATASTMAVIAFFDAVAIYLMEKTGYTREQFALIHPGGAVGDRLVHNKE
ncbi:SIS domain-containing protein [Enterocloster aldenensis]|uniref:KpsF/GutQ family sugar-phosphate isomerase n=1 Tax=Enterocloster aldenensis TaxID=358742 RepID=UPI000E540A8B|nr:SIS domain-containing protein [Enterocloster aldenensis]